MSDSIDAFIDLGPSLELAPHPIARQQVLSKIIFTPGETILSIPSYASVLLLEEKSKRCDTCHRRPIATSLRRCSGCASYWYCDATCQSFDWKRTHKRVCKGYNKYIASSAYQTMAAHEKMDALLLAHVTSRVSDPDSAEDLKIFLSLLPGPMKIPTPSICVSGVSPQLLDDLFVRFGNNNFAVHSHLTTVGHGVFPLASRVFNHSCVPNAAVKYVFTAAEAVRMEVVALREICIGEQICIPYLDPALLQSRTQIFELTYGFRCDCLSCSFMAQIGKIPEPSMSAEEDDLAQKLHQYVSSFSTTTSARKWDRKSFPPELYPILHESYVQKLSEKFSAASHDGPYDIALSTGSTLLDLYYLIYPPNYPQIGMHLLEMAKTAWNAIVSTDVNEPAAEVVVKRYLASARDVLEIFGKEGDEDGPLQEVEMLENLVSI